MSNTRIKIKTILTLGTACLLASCASLSSPATATQADIADGTLHPESSPTPTLDYQIHSLTLLPGAAADEWHVVGLLHNESEFQIEEVRLALRILDAYGQALDQVGVWAGTHFIDIDEESPFAAQFVVEGTPASVEVEVVSYELSEFTRPEIEVQVEDTIPIRTGGSSALGYLVNTAYLPAYISAVPMLVFDAEGEILDYAIDTTFISALGPRQDTPIGALFLGEIPFDVRIEIYPDVIQDDRRGDTDFEFTPPISIVTSQGKLIALGEFQNSNWQQHLWLQAVIIAELDGETLSIAPMIPPNPIAPGESRAYAVADLPGLHERLARQHAGVEQVEFDIVMDLARSGPVEGTVVALTLNVEAYEAIGSSIFIRGSVTNDSSQDVQNASIMACLRSTQGLLRSAGWLVVAEELDSGATAPFTMSLDVPSGENVLMLEFDLIASGLNP
jgi:hypothetical protein